nr:hypothetical protein [Tanacetum cinerariifolium]
DDAEGVECLPNEEIFAELARMGYEKPSIKLKFYKDFFSSQWKFLIHTILQCMKHLEFDKVAQALEITKFKRRVKKLERRNKGMMITKMDQDADVVLEDDKEVVDEAKEVAEDAKNVAGFKMDYFKGMLYDDIRPIFEAKFNTYVAFLLKTNEHIEEEESKALKRLNEAPAKKVDKRRKLDEEDLEALWSLVKERFSAIKPKNFYDDFLLVTLGAMFEKPDIHAQI